MIKISDALPLSVDDVRSALIGAWGADEVSDELVDLSLGSLSVRIYQGAESIEPLQYKAGAADAFAQSLAILAFEDGTSIVEALDGAKNYGKKITMGILIARNP